MEYYEYQDLQEFRNYFKISLIKLKNWWPERENYFKTKSTNNWKFFLPVLSQSSVG